jgi:hypothetical protein
MENRFDLLTKIFAGEGSRRDMIRRFGGLLAGASVVSATACESNPTSPQVAGRSPGGASPQIGGAPGRCKRGGQQCRENEECCSEFCDPLIGRCACPPGQFVCPATGICVECPPTLVFNPATCACECPPFQETCTGTNNVSICCHTESTCCNTVFGTPFCCPPSREKAKCCSTPTGLVLCCTPPLDRCCESRLRTSVVCCSGAGTCCSTDNAAVCCPPGVACCTSGDAAACCPPGTDCCKSGDVALCCDERTQECCPGSLGALCCPRGGCRVINGVPFCLGGAQLH